MVGGGRISVRTVRARGEAGASRPHRRRPGPCSHCWPSAPRHRRTRSSGGVAWLARTQRADGGWDEPFFTGTGFPGDFSINYGLYRLVFR